MWKWKYNYSFFSFKQLFRLTKEEFRFILNKIKDKFPPSVRCTKISVENKLAAVLRFLAHGSYQPCVGQDAFVGMAQSTVSKVLSETLNIMEDILCPMLITLERTTAQEDDCRKWFYDRTGFPNVIGAIDGCHIGIIRPSHSEHLYFNRKGYHSLNVMMVS